MKLFCDHDYEIIKEHTMESVLDVMARTGAQGEGLPVCAMVAKYIIVYKCRKCNRIKESVFTNPE